ncbi:MAG: dTDP-4-dehydrorhamnose 3,5-epimerase family protein, partial [Rikenellaceae bacterium]
LTLEENTEFLYKCTDYYYPQYDGGILWSSVEWNFELLGIKENELIMSEKDKNQPQINQIKWEEIF